MKITYDSQIFGAQTYGGVSRYFCEIASRIARMEGMDVSITAPMHINAYIEHLPSDIVSGFPSPATNFFRKYLRNNYADFASRAFSLLLGDCMVRLSTPDILHETYFSPYKLGSRNLRRVITIHDMIHEKFPDSFPNADKTARYKAKAAARADHVICVSESTRKDVLNIMDLPYSKTSVIHHGFNLMDSRINSGQKSSSFIDSPYLLYVGNRRGYKNFSAFLEVYGTSPELKDEFSLVCFGGGSFNIHELKMIENLNIPKKRIIQLTGDDQLLATLYQNAIAFIYPSLYEGFGIPPLEAMSYGCPVICSNVSSIPEVVGKAGEYFDPRNLASMRSAINRVLSSIDYRNSMTLEGYKHLKCFSWDSCAANTVEVYRSLI